MEVDLPLLLFPESSMAGATEQLIELVIQNSRHLRFGSWVRMIPCVGEGGHAQATVCMSHLPPCARQFLSCSMLHRPGWQAHKLLRLLCLCLSYLGWSTRVIATSATVFNFYVILGTRIHVFLLAWQALYPISILVSCCDFFRYPVANSVVLVNFFPVCAQWAILSLTSLTPNRLISA